MIMREDGKVREERKNVDVVFIKERNIWIKRKNNIETDCWRDTTCYASFEIPMGPLLCDLCFPWDAFAIKKVKIRRKDRENLFYQNNLFNLAIISRTKISKIATGIRYESFPSRKERAIIRGKVKR